MPCIVQKLWDLTLQANGWYSQSNLQPSYDNCFMAGYLSYIHPFSKETLNKQKVFETAIACSKAFGTNIASQGLVFTKLLKTIMV